MTKKSTVDVTPAHEIGELVYCNLPEGVGGRVIDWRFLRSINKIEYLVMWGIEFQNWHFAEELSETPVYS